MHVGHLCLLSTGVWWQILSVIAGQCSQTYIRNGKSRMVMSGRKIIFRCRPGYTLYGKPNAFCIGSEWSQQTPVCIAPGCPPLGPPANGNMTVLFNHAALNFSCMSGHHTSDQMTILCNGTNWNGIRPTCKANRLLTECDFDKKDICSWQQDDSDEFDWKWNEGSTMTSFTGPSWDHTHGKEESNGHYMYIETSGVEEEGDRAALLSPTYDASQSNTCFSFWYHMYGEAAGNIGSLVISVNSSNIPEVLFSETGDQGNTWNKGEVFIREMNTQFQIVITASKGIGWQGDIAIDDVKLWNCSEGFIWNVPATTSVQTPSPEFTTKERTSFETVSSSLTSTFAPTLIGAGSSKSDTVFTTATKSEKENGATIASDSLGNDTTLHSLQKNGRFRSPGTNIPELTVYLGIGIPVAVIVFILVIVVVCVKYRRKTDNSKSYHEETEAFCGDPCSPRYDIYVMLSER